jgi:hypothetical protein
MFKPPIAEGLELAADLVHRTLAGRPAIQQMMAGRLQLDRAPKNSHYFV